MLGTAAALGGPAEYLYDDRGASASTSSEDDVFIGLRLAMNDVQATELLTGPILDVDTSMAAYRLEASCIIPPRGLAMF